MFQQTLWTQWAPIMHLSWVQRTLWNKSRKKSYEFFKIGLLHKYGVHYEFHANPPIFKKSKNDQKPHKFKNHLTRCFTNILKLDLGWSNFNFGIFVYDSTSPLCIWLQNYKNSPQQLTIILELNKQLLKYSTVATLWSTMPVFHCFKALLK